jgi:hypothetical protein
MATIDDVPVAYVNWEVMWNNYSLNIIFLLAIVLSVLLRLRYSDYPFGIFKLSLHDLGTVNLNNLNR